MANWHGETAAGSTHEWYTPPDLFAQLDMVFDLDPCMPTDPVQAPAIAARATWSVNDGRAPVPWVPARRWYTARENGLLQPWDGTVWLNPPYGPQAVPFLHRLVEHGDGLALVFARTETTWWHASAPRASAVLFLRDRVHHIRADGHQGRGAMGSALLAYGAAATEGLMRAAGRIELGWLVTP